MYSVVMLAALSAGADAPPVVVVVPAVVVGSGCSGCSGCSGSYSHGHRHGKFHGHHSSCYGYGGGSYDGLGGISGYGYTSGFVGYELPYGTGYRLMYGTSYGYSCAGTCHGGALVIYAPNWGPPPSLKGYHSGFAPLWGTGAPVVFGRRVDTADGPETIATPDKVPGMPVPTAPMTRPGSDNAPQGASLTFRVPDDARLFVDGKLAPGTGPEREFATPALKVGQKFYYDVRAEVVVAGEKVVEEKRVVVEAGATQTVSFPVLIGVAARPSGVARK